MQVSPLQCTVFGRQFQQCQLRCQLGASDLLPLAPVSSPMQCTLCGRQFRGEWGNLQILEMIAQHDFSLARAALVASVPGPKGGTHRGESRCGAVP